MKKASLKLALLVAGILVTTLPACKYMNCTKGSGHIVSENRKVANFEKIDIAGNFKITLKQDSSLSLAVNADDNLIKYIKTEVEGNKLRILSKKNTCNGHMDITIGIRNLNEISASGAVELTADSVLHTGDIAFHLSGASKITLNLNAANVTTEGSGALEMNLKGQASSHTIDVSGVGKIHAFDFVVGNYDIGSTGANECEINVLHSLNVHTTGASSVKYRGNPSNITNDKTGASTLEKVN